MYWHLLVVVGEGAHMPHTGGTNGQKAGRKPDDSGEVGKKKPQGKMGE